MTDKKYKRDNLKKGKGRETKIGNEICERAGTEGV
jgi:hypothetical protein